MTSMAGRLCVVTGGSSGIGRATAIGLARMGADVVVVGRTPRRLTDAVRSVDAAGRGQVSGELCDFAHLADVRALADRLLAAHPQVHVLVNNAGQVLQRRQETPDGYEATFAVNHLAPYLLTRLLLSRLLDSTPSRVVTVASDAYKWGLLDFEDLHARDVTYRPMKAYGNSKLANVLFSWELARRTAGTGLTSNAVHPGFVSTSLARDNRIANVALRLIRPFVRSPEKGAETSLHLASAAEGASVSGRFWVDCRPVDVLPKAEEPEWALRLWETSADLVGLPRH